MKRSAVTTANKWLQLPDHTLGVYNYLDCLATARVWGSQTEEQQERGQHDYYRQVWWPLVPHVMAMARRGLLTDPSAVALHSRSAAVEIAEAQAACGPTVNLNSPSQRACLLYDDLGLRCPKVTPTGAQSTDQFALDSILRNLRKKDQHAVPVIHALFHRSRWNTIATRYLKVYPDPVDGRVRPTIKMASAETLRLAYVNPPIQQYPKEIRDIFVPEPGCVFLSVDFSQLEARILAILSGDEPALDVFAAGGDIHRQNALDLGFAQVGPKERDYAKTFLYGITYGGKAESLRTKLYCPCLKCKDSNPDTLSISKEDKVAAERQWLRRHPAVLRFRSALVQEVRRTRSLTSRFGYRRFFFAPADSILPEIYNQPMQTHAAELVNDRFIACAAAGYPPVLQIHDELVFEVPKEGVEDWASGIQEVMEAPVPELGGAVFPVSVRVGENWRDLKELPVGSTARSD